MFQPAHTYGPNCYQGPSVAFSSPKDNDDIPAIKAQFFYNSSFSIDEPITVVPDPKSANNTLRPFLPYDNHSLEETWLSLSKYHKKAQASAAKKSTGDGENVAGTKAVNAIGKGNKRKESSKHSKEPPKSVDISTGKTLQQGNKDKQHQSLPPAREEDLSVKLHYHYTAKTMQGSLLVRDMVKDKLLPPVSDTAVTVEQDDLDPRRGRAEAVGMKRSKSPSPTKSKSKSPSPKSIDDARSTPNKPRPPVKKDIAKKPIKSTMSPTEFKSSKKVGIAETVVPSTEAGAKQIGNPYNPSCADPHHAPLDADFPNCCQDLERDPQTAEHVQCLQAPISSEDQQSDPKKKQDKSKGKQVKSKDKELPSHSELADAQGDATRDARSSRNKDHSLADKSEVFLESLAGEVHHGREKAKRGKSPSPNSRDKSKSTRKPENLDPADKFSSVGSGDAGTTGLPFLKLPSRNGETEENPSAKSQQLPTNDRESRKSHGLSKCSEDGPCQVTDNESALSVETFNEYRCKKHKNNDNHLDVAVGVSRLHQVELPALQMKPIYWSPVHDVVSVTRGTWFYKDMMSPVEPAVANQLEIGYREVRGWSNTWHDQLVSAVEVGAHGEEKIVNELWPKEEPRNSKTRKAENLISSDPYCASKHFYGEASAEGTAVSVIPDEKLPPTKPARKKYLNSQVIYKDDRNAFILRPAVQPSAYHSRRPLNKIMKGFTIGIHVVRGFDWMEWEKLHPPKKGAKYTVVASASGEADAGKKGQCPGCKAQDKRSPCTDLIFVVHGIGQKLSERVESFHFTYAITQFRNSVNSDLQSPNVKSALRDNMGGIMVLPINWRSRLSFEEGGPQKEGDEAPDFSLKDITLDTIPAVRSLISDVMLDIPYYMSQHRPKMIRAVVDEANRVYRLWCQHNPDFIKEDCGYGRVHILAHSLGSAIALDVLSKQPTSIPFELGKKASTTHFDFNTTNLFFVGSPASFFLLLGKGKLVPRYNKSKPGADRHDYLDTSITGPPEFGSLAVDNIYNIMHPNDPVAYRLNAAVDAQYSESLKMAIVPSAATSLLGKIAAASRSIAPGVAPPINQNPGQSAKHPGVARLPSQLEMEVHDFSREEIAEKKFYLLNDNGQVDYILPSDIGPFGVVYINMLSAHSSYWGSPELVRLIVTEVGREPGKQFALPGYRAVKVGRKV